MLNNEGNETIKFNEALLPIHYRHTPPREYKDGDEYLRILYKSWGIIILGVEDEYHYKVKLPEFYTIKCHGLCQYSIIYKPTREMIVSYIDAYDYEGGSGKVCMDAYVNRVH